MYEFIRVFYYRTRERTIVLPADSIPAGRRRVRGGNSKGAVPPRWERTGVARCHGPAQASRAEQAAEEMVPGAGVEPARGLPRGILSPLRLPIPPPGQRKTARCAWRLSPESNRGTRLCRPLHNHSATQPVGGRIIAALPPGSPCGTWPGHNTRHHRLNRVDPGRKLRNRPVKNTRHRAGGWSGKRDSNSRPQPWQGCALPTELFPHGS